MCAASEAVKRHDVLDVFGIYLLAGICCVLLLVLTGHVLLYWFCYILFVITFALQLYFCLLSWRKRHITTGYYLFFWMLCGTIWALGTMVCMPTAVPEGLKSFLDPIRMSGVVWTPVVMTVFALEYAGARRFINRFSLLLLSALPLVSQVLLLSPWSRLFVWADRPPLNDVFVSVKFTHGPWFAFHTIYSMALVLLAGAVFMVQVFKNKGLLRAQSLLVLTGYFFPVAGMMLSAYPPPGFPLIDYSSLAFPMTAACWYVALFRYKLLEAAPIAQARIVEVMEDAVVVLTPQLTIVDANESALEVMQCSAQDDVLARPLFECWADAPEQLVEMLGRQDARVQLEVAGAHGARVFDARYSVIKRSRRRDPVGGVLVMRDITEQMLLIEELNAYAHMVAHDLKNPLSAPRGYLEMVYEDSEDVIDEELRDDLLKVTEINESMVGIVHELLALASMRQSQGSRQIEPLPIDMAILIDHVKQRQSLMLAGVTLVEPEQWPSALGHAPWIEEVWANLVSNAVKYGGSSPHVTLGATVLSERQQVEFWVEDRGQGIALEKQAALFDEFSRLQEHGAIAGHGVGLSIVKRIMSHLGGEVGVESAPGEGSRFWFRLPLYITDAADQSV